MSLTTPSARHAKPRNAARARACTRFAGATAVVGLLVLLASSLSVPAQAHHRTDHPKAEASSSPLPAKEGSKIWAGGERDIDEACADLDVASGCTLYRDVVHGQVLWAESESRGVPGVTVTVTASGTSTEQRTVVTNDYGYFKADFGSAIQPMTTWTASTDGNDTYEGSQASGVFLADYSYPLPEPDLCLNWDC